MDASPVFIKYLEPAEVIEPGTYPFEHLPIGNQPLRRLYPTLRYAGGNALPSSPLSFLGRIVGSIYVRFLGRLRGGP